ncbi:glycosyl hydrolase [Steroidobacter flavus]|uniref:Glycosyl hydrolase n=1 Tax=Steroidobacter flavus TaxID=1842136 RepID=A0ABV8T3X2_9GAMM
MQKNVARSAIGLTAIALWMMHGPCAFAEGALDPVYRDFVEPPAAARPRVWWHWMNGNVTKEGIKLDLDWMQRVGIGGFQNFDAELLTPQVVEQRLAFMTPPWKEAMRYTIDLAEERGLEMAIAASPGWSETGGPWVRPEQAMKKLVWSELEIAGGTAFIGKLPPPPTVSGPFQDIPQASTLLSTPKPSVRFYADAAVLAYPVVGRHSSPGSPRVTSNGGESIDATVLSDGILTNSLTLKFGTADAPACLTFDYGRAASIGSMLLALPKRTDFFRSAAAAPTLEASEDGVRYRKVADVTFSAILQQTVSFAAVTARYFRVCFGPPPPPPHTDLLSAPASGANQLGLFAKREPPPNFQVSELRLFATPRIHHAEEKAGYAVAENYYALATAPVDSADAVPLDRVIDLTQKMQPDGTLAWTPPAGRWRIVRFGYSLTGKENHPATAEATGLEVDKLDRGHVNAYLDAYLGKYENAVGAQRLGAKGIRALLVDSIEVGAQNWTESLPVEFRRRRGYELTPWMPALTGVIVGSAEQSDRFLYDFRRTLADLLADHHYGQIAATARARGLINYSEALERDRPVLGDDMEMRRHAAVPMAAMWTYSPEAGAPAPARFADIRGAASVAHIYGQNLVAAESLTSAFAPWAHAPRDLKPMMDLEFVLGVNRPVIHTSVHQPLIDRPPGLSLAVFGQYFNRNETWAEQASAWVSYLARTSQLLQQGTFVADVAYFYGEEAPLTALYADQPTRDGPTGHGFDFANSDVLLNRLRVQDGDLVTVSGMRYRLLYLGGSSEQMTLPVLRRIDALVSEGASVVGNRPLASPSLADDPAEFDAIASRLWGGAPPAKGRVIPGRDVDAALAMIGVPRDVDYRKPQPDSDIMFLHRRLDDGDVYFLTNRKPRSESVEMSFRVTGKRPEIWRADDARREAVSYRIEKGRTFVSLQFAPHDAFFVVFREPATTNAIVLPKQRVTRVATLSGDWDARFQPGRGGPTSSQKLAAGSWTQSNDPAIRYFSGTVAYSKDLEVPRFRDGARLMLDLGDVRELAEVLINDRSLGVLWHSPYRLDITDALHDGGNRIEIRVTNLWANRLIGDAQPGARKITFTTYPPYEADAPLRPSGLLGPVTLDRELPAAIRQ